MALCQNVHLDLKTLRLRLVCRARIIPFFRNSIDVIADEATIEGRASEGWKSSSQIVQERIEIEARMPPKHDEQRLLRFAKLLVRPSIGSEAIAAD